ncbi:penicillin amidase domain-containing protein, putative [Eimeria praecox]|uniref:Penicillin amidase domain-containing protein, putative n=1 Tax=Eimeria praecox TaxID=51316 RepID=U6H5X2_9EIME|nr:penicillin amidase domain-containing protein, putative [Eimeria praecox]
MKLSNGMGIKSFLAVVTASSLALLVIQYYRTRDTWGYLALTYTDFFAFVVGLIGRPIISRFFTPDEAFWNTPQEVPGIKSTVRIAHDKNGVPYLSASSREDLCFGQGYLHAIALLFEGVALFRTVISEEAMLHKLRGLPPEGIACMAAYTQGVTEALKSLPVRPVEFVLLGHTPSLPFTLLDLAAISTIYSIMLNRGMTRDFVRVHMKEALGDKWKPVKFPSVEQKDTEWANRGPSSFPEMTEGPSSLSPEFGGPMHDRDPSAKFTRERMQQFKEDMKRAEDFYDLKHPKPWTTDKQSEETNSFNMKVDGSNGWAISGKLTKTGMPLLAGDPHVEVNAPGFWMPMWLKSDGKGDGLPIRAVGATAVGITGMFVGHNEHAAWTQTVAHTDIEDLYLIDLNEEGTHYFYGGKQYPLKLIEHNIYVKGRPNPIRHIARYSHHGPLFSDVVPPLRKGIGKNQALVYASVACEFQKMLFGKSWKDYIEMGQQAQMNEFVCVWATKEGAIGGSVTGAVPVRPYSSLPQFRNGSDPEQDWKGTVPQEQIPFVMNPKNGFVVAGNSVLANDPKRIFGEVFVPGHRVRRAHHLLNELKSKKKIEVEDLIKMQEDHFSENGCEFRDFVLKEFLHHFDLKNDQAEATALCAREGLTPYVARLLKSAMESWDCSMDASSYGASIYEVWLQMTLQEVFAANNWTDEALFSLAGGWVHPTWLPRTEALNYWRINLLSALKNKNSGILPEGYSMSRLLCKSSYETLMYLVGRLGPEVKEWQWGKLRSRYIDHLFAKDVPILRNLLGIGPLKWGGNFGTLKAHLFEPHILKSNDPLSGNFHRGIDTTSLRVIFDLNDWENSRWAYFPGVSGWVGSKHFGDTAEFLEDGKEKLFPMPSKKLLQPQQHKEQPMEKRQQAQRQQQQKQEF